MIGDWFARLPEPAAIAVWVAALLAGGTVAILGVIVAPCMFVTYKFDQRACHSFAQNTGRETRFVRYTLVQWDCLTPAADGKWIPTRNLRDFTSD